MLLGVDETGGEVLSLRFDVPTFLREVLEEKVTSMSWSFRVCLMGLERDGWKGMNALTLREGRGLICLLKEASKGIGGFIIKSGRLRRLLS